MKKPTWAIAALLTYVCTACHKNPGLTSNNALVGKWTIADVTTDAYDSTGVFVNSNTYIAPPGNFFQFNQYGQWEESLYPLAANDLGIGGTYDMNSSTVFTITNAMAGSQTMCTIDTLSASKLVFHHDRGTHFNGVTPGYLRYYFSLYK